jgi:beta-xylosidase
MKFLRHIITLAFAAVAHAQGPTEARPLLVGDWPDPTICKDGADYYMTHRSGSTRFHDFRYRPLKP